MEGGQSLGAALNQLLTTFNGFKQACGSQRAKEKGTVHVFGAHNAVQGRREALGHVATMRKALEVYKPWQDAGVGHRLLIAFKDKAVQESAFTLGDRAVRLSQDHIERHRPVAPASVADLRARLTRMAHDTKTVFAGSENKMYLSCSCMYLEIELDTETIVRSVKLIHTPDDTNAAAGGEGPAAPLADMLRRGEYGTVCRVLHGINALYALGPTATERIALYHAVGALETDMHTIADAEWAGGHTALQLCMQGHGLVSGGEFVGQSPQLTFFVPPLVASAIADRHGGDWSRGSKAAQQLQVQGRSGLLQMQGGAPTVLHTAPCVRLPAEGEVPHMHGLCGLCMDPPTGSDPQPAVVGLQLNPPVMASWSLLDHLQTLLLGSSSSPPSDEQQRWLPITSLVESKDKKKMTEEEGGGTVLLEEAGMLHEYSLSEGPATRTVALTAIPLPSLALLHPVLQLLRQQLAFSTLLSSILQHSGRKGRAKGRRLVVEVGCSSPASLQLHIRHRALRNLFAVRIHVALGGVVDATVHMKHPDKAPITDEELTAALTSTLSIPSALALLLSKCPLPTPTTHEPAHLALGAFNLDVGEGLAGGDMLNLNLGPEFDLVNVQGEGQGGGVKRQASEGGEEDDTKRQRTE